MMNVVTLAASDLRTAGSLLRNPAFTAVDLSGMSGFAKAADAGERALGGYCQVIDRALEQWPGLTNRGYRIERSA